MRDLLAATIFHHGAALVHAAPVRTEVSQIRRLF
jgi:hypothetical protein